MLYILISLSFFLVGVLVGRWSVIVLPAVVWVTWAVGIDRRWWGDPPGEFLVLGTVMLVGIGGAVAALGIGLRQATSLRQTAMRQPTNKEP
jgi:hypothetical protein